jgi:hypothetical protein
MTFSTSIISADLLKQVEALVSGSRIEKVETDDQLKLCVATLSTVKRTRADLEAERKTKAKPFDDGKKIIQEEYVPKISLLDDIAGNLDSVSGAYQQKKRKEEAEAKRIADEKAAAEKKRLAELESKKLEDEERLRREAQAKLDAAEQAKNADERQKLIDDANASSAAADTAMQQAVEAAKAGEVIVADTVSIPQTATPMGYKSKVTYSASVSDYRKAIAWIVENAEWAAIENQKFKDCVDSAMNKIAAYREDKFSVPGCELVTGTKGRVK